MERNDNLATGEKPKAVKRLAVVAALISVTLILLAARYIGVQRTIDRAPILPGALSESGYTPPGQFGHGTLIADEGFAGWVIFDRPHASGKVEKVCAQGLAPQAEADVDFLFVGGRWIKLRSGTATFAGAAPSDDLRVVPATTRWRGTVTALTAFPVRAPDGAYRAKILYSKLVHGHQSPLDYLQRLRLENPSCADMPAP